MAHARRPKGASLILLGFLCLGGCGHPQVASLSSPAAPTTKIAAPESDCAQLPPTVEADDFPTVPLASTPELVRAEPITPVDESCPPAPLAAERTGPAAWGIVGLRTFAFDQQVAPNGLEYKPLFALDMNFNLWLCRSQRVYLFSDSTFWGQRAAPGITNPRQGQFDFSKREFDFALGTAWNYYGSLEARVFAYSYNNLNRGTSLSAPSGYADGVGLENRYYLGSTYADLGTAAFDVARASFLSAGIYPTKDLVDAEGNDFKPGPFVRAYLTLDLCGPACYLYSDTQLIARRSCTPQLLKGDLGVAVRPLASSPQLEFRLGSNLLYDQHNGELETGLTGQVRFLY